MPKRRLLLVLIGGVVCVGLFVVIALAVRPAPSLEPEYRGWKLSQWVGGYPMGLPNTMRPDEEREAIRHFGTTTIPYLLKWMRYETPPWKEKLYDMLNPMIARVQPKWVVNYKKQRSLANSAGYALVTLGPKAEGAIRELERMLNQRRPGQAAQRAARALASLNKIEPLIAVVEKPHATQPVSNWDGVRPYGVDDGIRYFAVSLIGSMWTNARPAMPVVFECLRDKDALVVFSAIGAIERLELCGVVEPGLAVPALTNCLHHPIAKIRASAITLLGHFWWGYKEGRLAMPALRAAAGDPDPVVHEAVTNVLWEIGLQGFERVGGQ
jgi:hypothetical protein